MSDISERNILALYDTSGICHFEKWYLSLKDKFVRSAVFAKVTRLADPAFSGFKSVGSGVFELRIFLGSGYRVYFGMKGEDLVLLLGGGQKKSQKEDIDEAKKLWKKYKNEAERFGRYISIR